MRFGPLPTAEALGAVAGHTLRLGPHGVIKKGQRLGPRQIEALRAAGVTELVAARLEPDDVPEDEAASAVATACAGPGVRLEEAATGRCNLHALEAGLLQLDRERLDRLNLVDEAVTIATLPPLAPVRAGALVATVKVIPYAVRREILAACQAAVAAPGLGALRVLPYRAFTAGLILTRLPGVHERVLDKAATAQRARAERTGGRVGRELRVPHDVAEVAAAIRLLRAEGYAPLWLLGASAIADRRDVIPAAIEAAGGLVEHFGMPVDPGNLLLLGRLGGTVILGVPGCARALTRSGYDLVLERLAVGLPVARADLMTMGVGGLLQEIPSRGLPRLAAPGSDTDEAPAPEARPAPRVAAVVLAAGHSRRMGAANKLLLPVDGKPIVAQVIEALLATAVRPIVVVTGHQEGEVRAALAPHAAALRFVHNPAHEEGMGASLRAGVRHLAADADLRLDGALVCLGDMPRLRPDHLEALLGAFAPDEGRAICVPTFERKRGNPVLFAARYFDELACLEGDAGARALLERHAEAVARVPVADEGVLLDVDTPEALRALAPTPEGPKETDSE